VAKRPAGGRSIHRYHAWSAKNSNCIGVATGGLYKPPPKKKEWQKNLHNPFSCAKGTTKYVKVLCLVIVNVKYDRFVAIRCVFSSSKYSKTRFRPGFHPGPRWGSLRPLSRLGRGHLDRLSGPPTQIPGYAYE